MVTREELLASGEYREWSKISFVSNECETDEYRESQPDKGLQMAGEFMGMLRARNRNENLPPLNNTFSEEDTAMEAHVVEMIREWLHAVYQGFLTHDNEKDGWWVYAGANELKPLLELMFDYYWAHGHHPYGDESIEEEYQFFLDDLEQGG